MIEITRQFTGLAKKIDDITDVVDVLQWALENSGLYCTVSAKVDNTWLIEVGGSEVSSVSVQIGQWIVFDGDNFYALTEDEFISKGYSSN